MLSQINLLAYGRKISPNNSKSLVATGSGGSKRSEAVTGAGASSGDASSKRNRTTFSREQLAVLEREFLRENYISRGRRAEIARALQLQEATIKACYAINAY